MPSTNGAPGSTPSGTATFWVPSSASSSRRRVSHSAWVADTSVVPAPGERSSTRSRERSWAERVRPHRARRVPRYAAFPAVAVASSAFHSLSARAVPVGPTKPAGSRWAGPGPRRSSRARSRGSVRVSRSTTESAPMATAFCPAT